MITLILLLIIVSVTVTSLPLPERGSGALVAIGAAMTTTILALTDAQFDVAPAHWLATVAIALGALSYLIGPPEADGFRNGGTLR